MDKKIFISLVAGLLVGVVLMVVGIKVLTPNEQQTLGTVVGGAELVKLKQNFQSGFQVNGTDVMNSAGDLSIIGDFVASDGTATSSASLGATGDTGRGQLCMWNGDNYTVEYYPSNSTSSIIATSTTCTP